MPYRFLFYFMAQNYIKIVENAKLILLFAVFCFGFLRYFTFAFCGILLLLFAVLTD